jgi:hypothetical protein
LKINMSDQLFSLPLPHGLMARLLRLPTVQAEAERVPPEQGAQIMLDYACKHPLALRELARIMKYPLDGSEASAMNLGRNIPIIALKAK